MRVHIFYDNGITYSHYNDVAYSTITQILRKTGNNFSFNTPIVAGSNQTRLINFQTFDQISDINGQFMVVESYEKESNKNISELEKIITQQSKTDLFEFDETRFMISVEELKKQSFDEYTKLNKEAKKSHDLFFDDYVILITDKFVQSQGYYDPIARKTKKHKRKTKEVIKRLGPTIILSTAIPELMTQMSTDQRTSSFLKIDEKNGQSITIPKVLDEKDFFQTLIYYDLAKHIGVCSKYYEKLRNFTTIEIDCGERYCSDNSCSLSLKTNHFDQILKQTRSRLLDQNSHVYCIDCLKILRKMNSKKVKAKVRTYLR